MPATQHAAFRVLAMPGSLRRNSFNRLLLQTAARVAPPSLQLAICDLVPRVPMFDEDLEQATNGGPDVVRELRRSVAASEALLIATPEYNQSLPGVLKNLIDWLSRPGPQEVLVGKPVAIVGVSAGRWGTRLAQAALRQVLAATESYVMPAPMLFLRDGAALFDDHGLTDEATLKSLRSFLSAFARWIERVSEQSTLPPQAGESRLREDRDRIEQRLAAPQPVGGVGNVSLRIG